MFWNFPGGHMETGETPEETCVREVKEETGFDVKISALMMQEEGRMKKIGAGRTAEIYEHPEGLNQIIKLYRKDFPKEAIQQEFRASQLAFSLGIRTPQPIALMEKDGRLGIIFGRAAGVSLLGVLGKRPLALRRHAMKLANLHFRMHEHRVTGELASQKDVLMQNIESAAALTDKEKQMIKDFLGDLPEGDRLCHGDFHPDNVIIGEADWVIDWMTGMKGHPAGDVARTVLLLSTGSLPEGIPGFMKMVMTFFRNRLKNRYLKSYLKLSGLHGEDIDRWILPVAAARLTEWLTEEEQAQLLAIIRQRLKTMQSLQ